MTAAAAARGLDASRRAVLGVEIHAVEKHEAVDLILDAARDRRPLAASALAVHGVMTGVLDESHRARLNSLDLVVADGQPVRWALRWLHHERLAERVYGPELMLELCARAADEQLPIYLYGSTEGTIRRLAQSLTRRFPTLSIAGTSPSRFRTLTPNEQQAIADEIARSGARIVFVGLGCPRQEIWVFENRALLSLPLVAVGAAFDFHAGVLAQAPRWMQRAGLEWLFRLAKEPRRLWRRYLLLNPLYLAMVAAERLGLRHRSAATDIVPPAVRCG